MKYIYNNDGIDVINRFIDKKKPSKILILTDNNTQKHCLPLFQESFSFEFTNVNILNGDENKNIETLTAIWEAMIDAGADRKSLILNLGGGVVTDIGGFAAVTFKRGLDFIHIPTTLLGMVDAAIGGKNGINFKQAKNQIGTIIPPEYIWINTSFLQTLPEAEMDSGFAEMLKHGLIADENYWDELIAHYPFSGKLEQPEVLKLIKKSVEIKDKVITSDPMERGLRKILNFGHTLGHAIESYLNYQKKIPISHGKSVAIGMILAVYLSYKRLGFDAKKANDVKHNISRIYSKIDFTKTDVQKIIELLIYDKKNENGKVNFVLLSSIGQAVLDQHVPEELIYEAFDYYNA